MLYTRTILIDGRVRIVGGIVRLGIIPLPMLLNYIDRNTLQSNSYFCDVGYFYESSKNNTSIKIPTKIHTCNAEFSNKNF